jgi:transposase
MLRATILAADRSSSAQASLALHGERVDFQSLQFEVRQEVQLLRMLDHNIAELEKQIEVLYQRQHPSDALRSIPGIGPTLAPLLVGALAQAERFRNERHVRGFCGLFPTKSSSGGIDRPGQPDHQERQ